MTERGTKASECCQQKNKRVVSVLLESVWKMAASWYQMNFICLTGIAFRANSTAGLLSDKFYTPVWMLDKYVNSSSTSWEETLFPFSVTPENS